MQSESSAVASPAASVLPLTARFAVRSIQRSDDGKKFVVLVVLENPTDGEIHLDRKGEPTLDVVVTAKELQSYAAFQRAAADAHGVWLTHAACEWGGRCDRSNWQAELSYGFSRG